MRETCGSAIDRAAVEEIVEEIRLTSLNMAVAAARLKVTGERRTAIRKEISDLLTISLNAAKQLTKAIAAMTSRDGGSQIDPASYLEELEALEEDVLRRSREIMQLLESDDGLSR